MADPNLTEVIVQLENISLAVGHIRTALWPDTAPAEGVMPISQRDSRWAAETLGFSTHGQTLGSHGCAITALCMLINYVLPREGMNPSTLNTLYKNSGGFVWDSAHTDQNLVDWTTLSKLYVPFKLLGKVDCPTTPAPMEAIDDLLRNLPVIVYVDAEPKAGLQQHFVVLTKKRTTTYDIANPWTGTMQTLDVYAQPKLQTPAEIIQGFLRYVWV